MFHGQECADTVVKAIQMAGHVATPWNVKLQIHRNRVSNGCFSTRRSSIKLQRKCAFRFETVARLSLLNDCKFGALHVKSLEVNAHPKNNSMRSYCLGSLLSTDGATAPEWVLVIDQVLLMASVCLTYMAGVIPAKKMLLRSPNGIPNDYPVPGDSTFSGRAAINEEVNLKLPWDVVEEKLMDALNAVEHVDNLGSRSIKFEQGYAKRPLSLYAVPEGPRFRLLWASFQWLKKEVDNISGRSDVISMNDRPTIFSEIIKNSCQAVCTAWLEKELFLKSSIPIPDRKPISLIVEKLTGDVILRNIRNSGKEDLYAELGQYLIFGSPRVDCCYGLGLFTDHGVAILEDLVITLADGIASAYLELISVDSNMSNEISCLGLVLCTMSTRELQKLRNEVALNQWLHQNMEAVVSMYEDRFDLGTLKSQLIEEPSKTEIGKFSWWKKLTLRKSESLSSPLRYVLINYISVTVKRTKELRALNGWKYYFSLFLELTDITMPLIRAAIAKISDAISFFLVCLIGRSLGLIYTGIRQSLRWK